MFSKPKLLEHLLFDQCQAGVQLVRGFGLTPVNPTAFVMSAWPVAPTSVRHQHRHGHALQNGAGGAAESPFARPAVAIGAHHQQVDIEVGNA